MFAVFWSDHVLDPIHAEEVADLSMAMEAGLDVLSILSVIITVVLGTDFVIHLRSEEEGEDKEEEKKEVVTEKKTKKDKKDE